MRRTSTSPLFRALPERITSLNSNRGLWIASIPVILLLLVIVGLAGYNLRYSSSIYPGVKVMGMPLGGLTPDQANTRIREQVQTYLSRPVTFQYGNHQVKVPAHALGLTVNTNATSQQAFQVGRSGGLFGSWSDRVSTWIHGRTVPVSVSFNRDLSRQTINRLAQRVDTAPQNASIVMTDSGPVLHPSQTGVKVDVSQTVNRLSASLNSLYFTGRSVQPVVHVTPPSIATDQIKPNYQTVQAAWSNPITISYQGQTWTIPASQVHEMLVLKGSGPTTAPVLDETQLRKHLQRLSSEIYRKAQNADIKMENGQVALIEQHNGYKLDVDQTLQRVEQHDLTSTEPITPVVNVTTPQITGEDLQDEVRSANALISQPLTLTLHDQTWTLNNQQLADMLKWKGVGADKTPYIDPDALRSWVRQIASQVNSKPTNASIKVEHGQVKLTPSATGTQVQVDKTVNLLLAAAQGETRNVEIQATIVQPEVRTEDIQQAAQDANTLISGPVTLTYGQKQWTVDTQTLVSWLRWNGSGADVAPYLDQDAVAQFVQSIADSEDKDMQNAYLSAFKNDQYMGKVFIMPDQTGISVDVSATEQRLQDLAWSTDQRTGEVVVYTTQPDITASDLQGPLEKAKQLTAQPLNLKLGDTTWTMPPTDIVRTSRWTDNEGADTTVWLDTNAMIEQLRQVVPYQANGKLVNYIVTAQRAVDALDNGDYTVQIATVDEHKKNPQHQGDLAVWNGAPPDKWIDINLSTQTMAAYENDKQVKVTLVTTGNYVYESRRTPTGVFYVLEKVRNHVFHSPFPKDSPFYYEPSPTKYDLLFRDGGYYIHDAPWRSQYGPGTNMDKGTPGEDRTGSHGCVNTPPKVMKWLWNWADDGTPVVIHY